LRIDLYFNQIGIQFDEQFEKSLVRGIDPCAAGNSEYLFFLFVHLKYIAYVKTL